jgi:ABC-type nickel/cobalt efflux system permease component RcnA
MELSLVIIFWYGVLHAFGPDHLTAIADFSIGKSKKRTMLITTLFATGHGLTLFIFAKILEDIEISDSILAYGDTISAIVIIGMGLYILFMVYSNRIQLRKHSRNGEEHIHIWFGKEHQHSSSETTTSFTMGLLMGIGGVRGMLITLGAIGGGEVNILMVASFTLGVISIFLTFGVVLLYLNQNFLDNIKSVKRVFTTAGIISLIVGTEILLG